MPPDLSQLSTEELQQLYSQQSAPTPSPTPTPSVIGSPISAPQPSGIDLSGVSTKDLLQQYQSMQPWNIVESAKNLGSGAIEGTAGLVGLAADLNPFSFGGPKLDLPATTAISETIDPYLADRDPKYRYARTLGGFIGPGGIFNLRKAKNIYQLGKAAIPDVTGALGAQAAEDVTGSKVIAPIAGGIFGSALPSAVKNIGSGLRALFKGATDEEITGSAALAWKQLTDLSPQQLDDAIKAMPDDELAKFMSTAEVTGNAGAAQIEKSLGATPEGAGIYNASIKAREKVRKEMLDRLTTSKGVNKERLGTDLIEEAEGTLQSRLAAEQELWANVPRNEQINVGGIKKSLNTILEGQQGGLKPGSQVNELVNQVIKAADEAKTSGALQDIRSDALSLLREAKLKPVETRLLNTLQKEIDGALGQQLKGDAYDAWKLATGATKETKDLFARGTAGGALTGKQARPAAVLGTALKGDERSVKQLRGVLGDKPELIEDVKRAVIDSIPTDASGNLTLNGTKRFLNANEGELKQLYGSDGLTDIKRIYADLASQAEVASTAFGASKGGSVTQQRTTVAGAIQDVLTESVIPGSGILSKLAESVKGAAGIKDAKAVESLLLRASMEPRFALELAKAPTTERVLDVLGRLVKLAKETTTAGAKGAAFATSQRTMNNLSERDLPVDIFNPTQKPAPIKESAPIASKSNISAIESQIDSDPIDAAIYEIESGRNPKAKNPNSSAKGGFQLIDQTAKALGVKDPLDLAQNYAGYQKLKADSIKQFGNNPTLIYAAHYLGSPLLKKVLAGKPLTAEESRHVRTLETQVLPKFAKIYEQKLAGIG